MTVPTNTLIQFTMVGQLLVQPYESVYWSVYNVPDFAGTFSGYVGQLQNITIAATKVIDSPDNDVNIPTGPASGDLTGNYPSPLVVGIDGTPINQNISPSNGQVLAYNATDGYLEWTTPAASGNLLGDVTGPANANTVVKLRGKSLDVSLASLGAAQDGYVMTWENGAGTWQAEPTAPGFTAGGDLSGTSTSQTVIGIQGTPVNPTPPTTGQVLTYAGGHWQGSTPPSEYNVFVYREGGIAGANVYTSFAAAYAARQLVQGHAIIEVDDSNSVGNSHITNGTYNMFDTELFGVVSHFRGDEVGAVPLSCDGYQVHITNLTQLTNIELSTNSNTTANLAYTSGFDSLLIMRNATLAINDGYTGTLLNLSGGAILIVMMYDNSAFLSGTEGNVVTMSGSSYLFTYVYTSSFIQGNIISDDGTCVWESVVDASALINSQSGFSGTRVAAYADNTLMGKSLNTSLTSVGAPQDGYVLTWDNTDGYWYANATGVTSVITMNGDVVGPSNANLVDKITGSGATAVPVNVPYFVWTASPTANFGSVGLLQTQAASGSGLAMFIEAQSAATGSGGYGGELLLTGGNGDGAGAVGHTVIQTYSLTSAAGLNIGGVATDFLQLGAGPAQGANIGLDNGGVIAAIKHDNSHNINLLSTDSSNNVYVADGYAHNLVLQPGNSVTIPAFTVAGIVHNAVTTGVLTSSLIVNADVSATAAITVGKLAAGTSAQVLMSNATPTSTWTTISGDATISATGVVKVTGIDGYGITPLADGYLFYNGTSMNWVTLSGISPGGTAGGDLSGTYPNPTVAKINGTSVPAGGSLTTGNQLIVSGAASATWASLNLAGGSGYVTGALPVGNIANGTADQLFDTNHAGTAAEWFTLGGDATFASHNLTVTGIQSNTVTSGALVKGNLFIATTTSNWASTAVTGDVSFSTATPGLTTLISIDGYSLPNPGNHIGVLQSSGSALTWATVGTANITPGTAAQFLLTNGTPATTWATMSGDATTGNTGVITVQGIRGKSLNSSLASIGATQDGYVLTWDNTDGYWYAKPGSGGSGVTTVGAIDTNANSNALYISGTTISTQSASATNPGMVNTTTQTMAGNKTFSGSITAGGTSTNNTLSGGLITSTQNTTTNITCGDGYYLVAVGTLTGSITVTLPSSPATGRTIVVKDVNGTCQQFQRVVPGTGVTTYGYTVTISPSSGNIDGLSSLIMDTPYFSITAIYTGSQWSVI